MKPTKKYENHLHTPLQPSYTNQTITRDPSPLVQPLTMTDQSTPEPFDPSKFVKGLTSPQLEMIAEFQEEAQAALRLLTRAGRTFRAPTGKDMLEVFTAAEPELLERFADQDDQFDDQPPQWRSDEAPPKKGEPKTAEAEWRRELGYEIKDQGKRKGLPLPVVATPKEVQGLFDATKDHHRNYLILRTLYASGVRREEITNIRVADLYPNRNIIFISQGKYDRDRYVFIDEETSRLLAEYTKDFLLTDKIFDLSTRTINRVVNGTAEKTGLRQRLQAMGHNFTPHALRHAYATHMYENGADPFVLKTLLGHKYLKTTKTYVHVAINALSERYFQNHPLAIKGSTPPGRPPSLEELDEESETD